MTHRNLITRGLAFAAVAGISTLAFAPAAMAAGTVSQAEATALTVEVAGNGGDSGTVSATNDGSGEEVTGTTQPPISVLGNQDVLAAGVLVQEANADVVSGAGVSDACAGITSEGGQVVAVGDSSCLKPGASPVKLELGNLDLSGVVVVDPASALGPLADANAPLEAILSSITKPLADAIGQTPLKTSGLTGSIGAVAAQCTAEPGRASGDSYLTDVSLDLDIAGQKVDLVTLPAQTAPNTDLLINLDKATDAITNAVETELTEALSDAETGAPGPLTPLAALSETLQEEVIDALVAQIRTNLLTPLSKNVATVTINKQNPVPAINTIAVTALDIQVLPAAEKVSGSSLASVEIGHVKCGPNNRVAAGNPGDGGDAAGNAGEQVLPPVPTRVTSGAELASSDLRNDRATVLGAMGALLLMAGAGGLMRRRLSQF